MIAIISDNNNENFANVLKEELLKTENQVSNFEVNNLDIKPCIACGSCSAKTFGRCIIQDDMQKILSVIKKSRKLILITPIIFGGVSFNIKKVMDRMSSLGDPRYFVKDGELVKGMRVQNMEYYMIGIKDNLSEEEKLVFLELFNENKKIMNVYGKAFVLDSKFDKKNIDKIVKEIIHE